MYMNDISLSLKDLSREGQQEKAEAEGREISEAELLLWPTFVHLRKQASNIEHWKQERDYKQQLKIQQMYEEEGPEAIETVDEISRAKKRRLTIPKYMADTVEAVTLLREKAITTLKSQDWTKAKPADVLKALQMVNDMQRQLLGLEQKSGVNITQYFSETRQKDPNQMSDEELRRQLAEHLMKEKKLQDQLNTLTVKTKEVHEDS